MLNSKNRTTSNLDAAWAELCLRTIALCAVLTVAGFASAQDSGLGGFLDEEFDPAAMGMQEPGQDGFGEEPGSPPGDAQGGDAESDLNFTVEVDNYDLVDLHVNNEELGRVLQLLSIQSERNIVASPQVAATITADLYGVTFYEALDAILHVNGFGYIEQGNFIYVYTREELEAIEVASREMVTKVITLDYLNAADAAEFCRNELSETGAITTSVPTEIYTVPGESPIGADTYANSALLVVHDYEENIESILELIAEIDVKPVQVLVEATILQTGINELNAFGMDFSVLNNINFADFAGSGGPLSVASALINGTSTTADGAIVNAPNSTNGNGGVLGTTIGNQSGSASMRVGLVNEDMAVFLRLLDEVTDTTVISNPKILTLNRQSGRVLVGTRVGYLSTTSTETSTTQSVEFLDVGTELQVRPFVSKNGVIRLELRPQVSSASLREATGSGGSPITIPDEDTTELTTNVMVRDGQTVVLGGLFTETTVATRRQVPVLGNIPMIGQAFQGHDDQTRRTEIIFMITPSIVNDTMINEDGELAQQYVEHTRVSARAGTLPFSRERRVGKMLIEARRLADAGQTAEAILKVRKALTQQPNSFDARAMLEELTGDHVYTPTRSMLEGILHKEMLRGEEYLDSIRPDAPLAPVEPAPVDLIEDTTPPAPQPDMGLHMEPIGDTLPEADPYTPVVPDIEFVAPEPPPSFDGGMNMEPLEPITPQEPAQWPVAGSSDHKFGDLNESPAVPSDDGWDWNGTAAPDGASDAALDAIQGAADLPVVTEPSPATDWDWADDQSRAPTPAGDSVLDAITDTTPELPPLEPITIPDVPQITQPQSTHLLEPITEDDIWAVQTETPSMTEQPIEEHWIDPEPAEQLHGTTTGDEGFLYVPMPGGGAVRLPWPMDRQARAARQQPKKFTTVPTDDPDDDIIKWDE